MRARCIRGVLRVARARAGVGQRRRRFRLPVSRLFAERRRSRRAGERRLRLGARRLRGRVRIQCRYAGDTGAQLIPYVGYARRDKQGRSWDFGLRYSHFTADSEANYVEAHVGVAFRRAAFRVHYAPDYFGQVSNWYLEADGSVPLGERIRWLWHAGVARSGETAERAYLPPPSYPIPGYNAQYAALRTGSPSEDRTRLDIRTGFALTTRICDVQLTWQHVDGDDATAYAAP